MIKNYVNQHINNTQSMIKLLIGTSFLLLPTLFIMGFTNSGKPMGVWCLLFTISVFLCMRSTLYIDRGISAIDFVEMTEVEYERLKGEGKKGKSILTLAIVPAIGVGVFGVLLCLVALFIS